VSFLFDFLYKNGSVLLVEHSIKGHIMSPDEILVRIAIVVFIVLFVSYYVREAFSFLKGTFLAYNAINAVAQSLSYEWQFLDEILIKQKNNEDVEKFMLYAKADTLEIKRMVMLALCSKITTIIGGKAGVALLTQELAEEYRVLIASFPEEYRDFYETKLSLKFSQTVTVTDGVVREIPVTQENQLNPKSLPVRWQELVLEKNPKKLSAQLNQLQNLIEKKRSVFRFKKVPRKGKPKKLKPFSWDPVFRPVPT
jgi:hypothetical protein